MWVLGQKPIARMDGLHIGQLGGANEIGDVEIAAGGNARTDANGPVG